MKFRHDRSAVALVCSSRAVYALVIALCMQAVALGGCASNETAGDGSTGATGATGDAPATGTTGGGGGVGGGNGGTGASDPGPCGMDCSTVETPMCLKAVCNEGQYLGTVGECVVVAEDDEVECDDGVFCTVYDTCLDGECVGGPMNDCGMEPPTCTVVSCDEGSRTCQTAPADDGDACDVTAPCEVNGVCTAGECKGAPKDCSFSPLSECNVVSCNPASGDCEGVADPAKDSKACSLTGDLCQVGKTCADGDCLGGAPKDCSSLTVNCNNGVCNPTNGMCEAEAVPAGGECDDASDECNVGICDANGDCNPMPLANGTPCTDYDSCTTSDSCAAGVCNGTALVGCLVYYQSGFENCPDGWTLANDWQCGTPTNVGPSAAHQGSGVLGTVLDANYSSSQAWDTTVADSPPIDLGSATEPMLSMWVWIHTEGSSFDGMNLKISTDGGATYSVLQEVTPVYPLTVNSEPAWGGDQSALGWQFYTADLSAYAGQQIKLRYAFRSDGSIQKPGVYIDDMAIGEAVVIPIAITSSSPLSSAFVGTPYSVPLSKAGGSSGAVWSIVGGTNNGWMSIDPATGTLSGTPAAANLGPGTVVVRVEEPTFPTNFSEKTFAFDVATVIYQQTFEGACPNGWTLTGDWECGVPSTVGPPMAFSGMQCLGTQIDSNYNNSQAWATTTATSPSIDLTGITDAQLDFRVWLHTEGSTYDGFNLRVSTDGGATFNLVTAVTPAYPLTIDSQQAWGGDQSAAGWQSFSADLSAYVGQSVLLRFAFRSDSSIPKPGVYIDNFVVSH